MRAAVVLLLLLLLLLVAGLATLRLTWGGGDPYPDLSTAPRIPARAVETLATLPFSPGNVTVSDDGRIFFNVHPFTAAERFTDTLVYELVDGTPVPYPDAQTQADLIGVLGMTTDRQGRLWLLAPAGLEDRPTKLMAFDLATDARVVDEALESEAGLFSQDLRVSGDGRTVFMADTGAFFLADPALVVFDVETKTARRRLEAHPSVSAQPWQIRTADGPYTIAYGLVTFAAGVDGIALSHDDQWLYYATMNHDTLYRLPTAAVLDPELPDDALAQAIEAVGIKPLSDGIEVDAEGNVYITDIENAGIARMAPDGTLVTLTADPRVTWADAVTLAPDGSVLFTDSEIPNYIDPLLRPPARADLDAAGPHAIYRFVP